MITHIVDRVFENPAASGGFLVMALTASAIVSNAMFLQNGHHPGPLFAPQIHRLDPKVPALAARVPASAMVDQAANNDPPLPRLSPAGVKTAPPVVEMTATRNDSATLIAGIQRELARVGLYSGAMDGMTGPRTEAAIKSFQLAAGLKPTGVVSEALLASLTQPTSVALTTAPAHVDRIAAELDSRTQARAETIATAERQQASLRTQENLRTVQNALNRIGYGPVNITGMNDGQTQDAIRRFELDNGLDVTGEVNDAVIARLVAIGAIRAG